jgi:hypothetical protein
LKLAEFRGYPIMEAEQQAGVVDVAMGLQKLGNLEVTTKDAHARPRFQ